jgi:hypothetical protein
MSSGMFSECYIPQGMSAAPPAASLICIKKVGTGDLMICFRIELKVVDQFLIEIEIVAT